MVNFLRLISESFAFLNLPINSLLMLSLFIAALNEVVGSLGKVDAFVI